MEELFNVEVRDTQDSTIKDVHFYFMMKNKDEERWSFADINLDDAKKTDNQTLLECNYILINGLKKNNLIMLKELQKKNMKLLIILNYIIIKVLH